MEEGTVDLKKARRLFADVLSHLAREELEPIAESLGIEAHSITRAKDLAVAVFDAVRKSEEDVTVPLSGQPVDSLSATDIAQALSYSTKWLDIIKKKELSKDEAHWIIAET
jgi:hypothetical protein